MKFSNAHLLDLGREIEVRAQAAGITPERVQTFVRVLLETKDPNRAHDSAVAGLSISSDDEPFVKSMLGGNPIAQLLREGYQPKSYISN